MKTANVVDKKKLFWILNISGWWLMVTAIILIYVKDFDSPAAFMIHYLVRYSIGFIVCLMLVYFYRKFDYKTLSIPSMLLKMIPVLIISVHLWLGLEILKDVFISRNMEFDNPLTISRYSHDLFHNSVYLFWWSTLYLAIKFWLSFLPKSLPYSIKHASI